MTLSPRDRPQPVIPICGPRLEPPGLRWLPFHDELAPAGRGAPSEFEQVRRFSIAPIVLATQPLRRCRDFARGGGTFSQSGRCGSNPSGPVHLTIQRGPAIRFAKDEGIMICGDQAFRA